MFDYNVTHTELAGYRLFDWLTTSERQQAAAALNPLPFGEGDILFREGDASDTCYFIISGEVEIVRRLADGTGLSLAVLGRGDVFGEVCLLEGESRPSRTATAIARRDGRAWRLYRSLFESALEKEQAWAYKVGISLARILADRLARMNQELVAWMAEAGAAPAAHPAPPAPSAPETAPEAAAEKSDIDRLRERLQSLMS